MNQIIIDNFKLLIKQIKFDIDFTTGKEQMINMYRLRSIQQVLKILEKFPKQIKSSDQLKGIKNVGKKSLLRIDEILKTGKLSEIHITEDIDKYLNIISSLEDIIGIGRKTAYELFKTHNITSIEDLQNKYNAGIIKLPDNIVKGLKYYGKIEERIPRIEIDKLNEILRTTVLKIDKKLYGVICGSYRRELPVSNDVDFIIVHTDLKTKKDVKKKNYLEILVTELKNMGIIIDSLTSDDVQTKYMGIYRIAENYPLRRIDIRYIPYESFYYSILYFTGPKDFNRKMRQLAIDSGYLLNEYGLYDDHNKLVLKPKFERNIFEFLGMEYLNPNKRF